MFSAERKSVDRACLSWSEYKCDTIAPDTTVIKYDTQQSVCK